MLDGAAPESVDARPPSRAVSAAEVADRVREQYEQDLKRLEVLRKGAAAAKRELLQVCNAPYISRESKND